MIRKMRESNDNVFYCAECTYDKSNGTMFLYTTDITEVRGSIKPKDSMKVEGGFLVRRKYFRSEYEAQEYIDSLPNAMPMIRNESFRMRESSRNSRYVNESFDKYLDGAYSYVRRINNEVPPSGGYLDIYDCGDGSYKLVVMDDRGRVIKDVSDCYKPMPFVSFVRGLYQILKQW